MRSQKAFILVAASFVAGHASAEPPDLASLRRCARDAWKADVQSWSEYSFDRHVTLRDLDRHGEVKTERQRLFRLTPSDEGFDELLVREDGRTPSASEIRKARDKAYFSHNYQHADTLQLTNPLGEDLVLLPILGGQEYELVGEDLIDGIPCYRVSFDAGPEPRRASTEEQLMQAVRGSACISIDGCHVVLLDLETVRPIKQGLTRVEHLRLTIEGRPLGEEDWAPRKVEAQFDFAVMGKRVRRLSSYGYSNFRCAE